LGGKNSTIFALLLCRGKRIQRRNRRKGVRRRIGGTKGTELLLAKISCSRLIEELGQPDNRRGKERQRRVLGEKKGGGRDKRGGPRWHNGGGGQVQNFDNKAMP